MLRGLIRCLFSIEGMAVGGVEGGVKVVSKRDYGYPGYSHGSLGLGLLDSASSLSACTRSLLGLSVPLNVNLSR